jgi:RNA polymerase sigma factor (sigma-70 family)
MRVQLRRPSAKMDPLVVRVESGPPAGAVLAEPWATPRGGRADLATRARLGDRDAFEALVDRWIEPAFRTAMAILGNEADARDSTQDALLEAWRNIERLRDPDRFDAWLGRIHVNACRAIGRRRGQSRVREISVALLPDPEGPAADAIGVEDESASLDELERAFERLGIAERTILVLHHLEHRPVAEIASALGVPRGTVTSRLHAARAALARSLEEERR